MGWSYNFWKETFYPSTLKPNEYLKYYSSQFDTVEVNNTFYRIPNEKTILSWKDQTPPNFLFSLKFPRKITHLKMLIDAEEDTTFFLKRIDKLKEKLGILLLQFPANFTEKKIPYLKQYLCELPKRYQYAVEFRNKNLLNKELFAILNKNNIALVWTDKISSPKMEKLTADFLYIRWEGNRKKINGTKGKTELDQKKFIEKWAIKIGKNIYKTSKIFGYFSKYFSGNPTKDAKILLKLLSKTP
jgi:uncharacterized protein YecE (DUF72 family)